MYFFLILIEIKPTTNFNLIRGRKESNNTSHALNCGAYFKRWMTYANVKFWRRNRVAFISMIDLIVLFLNKSNMKPYLCCLQKIIETIWLMLNNLFNNKYIFYLIYCRLYFTISVTIKLNVFLVFSMIFIWLTPYGCNTQIQIDISHFVNGLQLRYLNIDHINHYICFEPEAEQIYH